MVKIECMHTYMHIYIHVNIYVCIYVKCAERVWPVDLRLDTSLQCIVQMHTESEVLPSLNVLTLALPPEQQTKDQHLFMALQCTSL